MIYYQSKTAVARSAEFGDIAKLKDSLRDSTVEEIRVLYDFTSEDSLTYSFLNSSFCYSIVAGDEVIAMGGIYKSMNVDKARIWFLSSNKLDKIERTFLRQCKVFISSMLDLCPLLYNYVDERNKPAMAWLKWIGAEFGDTIHLKTKPMRYFEFRNKV